MPSAKSILNGSWMDSRAPFASRAAADTSWSPGNFRNRLAGIVAGDLPIPGQDTSADALGRMKSFDPTASMDEYAKGAYSSIFDSVGGIKDQLAKVRGASVGGGRFNTGFRFRDEGNVMSRGIEDLDTSLAQGALQATGMAQRNIEDIGAAGDTAQNRYLSILSGANDMATAQDEARRQRNAAMWGDAIGAAGTVAGAVAGGPLGAAAAKKMLS